MDEQQAPPNHHADFPTFAGAAGFIAALSMVFGRQGEGRLAVGLSGMEAGAVVVDIGCGPGGAVRFAARVGAKVTGIDPAPVMLRVAKILTRPSAKVQYVEGSAEAIPLPETSASIAWSIASVHHWSDIDAGLREVRRILRPGGRLVAMERSVRPGARGHASHGWSTEQAVAFMARCREHGFTDVRLEGKTRRRRPMICVVATSP